MAVSYPVQYTLFVILAPMTALFCIGTILYARAYFRSLTTSALVWLMLPIVGWLVANTLELAVNTEAGTLSWAKITYGFVAFSVVAWLAFALQYSGHTEWLTLRRFGWFCLLPLVTIGLTWSNDLHRLVWANYRFIPIDGLLALNVVTYGPWFWVHAGYSYGLVFLGAYLIIRQYFRSFKLYRQQSSWVVVGALTPVVINVVYILRLFPEFQKDYTAIGLAFASLAFAIGMSRYRLFDLKPIARAAVVDSMSDAMLVVDLQHRVVDANPAARRFIGLPANQIIGRSTDEVLSPWHEFVERFRDQSDVRTEISAGRDGHMRYFDLQVSPLIDQHRQATGRLVVLRDMTERKQAEADLRRYTTELEARNEELDAFAHTVAHDLKNPLAALVGHGQALKKYFHSMPASDVDNFLDTIVRNGNKVSAIVDELLLLSQVRRLADVQITPIDMAAIVDEALDRLAPLKSEYQAQVVLPDRWPAACGHGPWVEEVWVNYLSNAFKYGGTPPRVELGAREQVDDTGEDRPMVRFWVRDHGPGIPTENQANLFTLFTQLEAAPSGYGIGLSIVHRIVKRLGGNVGVASQVGHGSLFWFTLPAVQARADS
jgi:PAS domain S-box-containing protein